MGEQVTIRTTHPVETARALLDAARSLGLSKRRVRTANDLGRPVFVVPVEVADAANDRLVQIHSQDVTDEDAAALEVEDSTETPVVESEIVAEPVEEPASDETASEDAESSDETTTEVQTDDTEEEGSDTTDPDSTETPAVE